MAGSIAVLIDFGSTFTKAVAVDLHSVRLLARAQHPSTVDTDVTQGFRAALKALYSLGAFEKRDVRLQLACSSARGGLRLAVIGLVPQLTAEAARRAALGAGAKVISVYSYEMTNGDVRELESLQPDLILLTGGTDGGNRSAIVHNARQLARSRLTAPVILAGNRAAWDENHDVLQSAGKQVYVTDNVMPELNELNVEPTRQTIRDAFVRHIVQAKGLERAAAAMNEAIIPTPAVVLDAARLLANGVEGEPGVGEVVVVDVGGATTDVHSVTRQRQTSGYVHRGLPEPEVKRTVEGDLGIRSNAPTVLEAARSASSRAGLRQQEGQPACSMRADLAMALNAPAVRAHVAALAAQTARVPATPQEAMVDILLASAATDIAVGRHAGYVKEVYGPQGTLKLLYGKDLRSVPTLVGVGGVFAAGRDPSVVLSAALFRHDAPDSLRPEAPDGYIDADYLFYAAGLLARFEPRVALQLLQASLRRAWSVGNPSTLAARGEG